MCEKLSIDMVAEGVETADEFRWLRNAGVDFFQGFYFARPAFESLPEIAFQSF
jgi:EAL domain-containing protein (putative c-di-GMP-specific phosphodiesterase class I)